MESSSSFLGSGDTGAVALSLSAAESGAWTDVVLGGVAGGRESEPVGLGRTARFTTEGLAGGGGGDTGGDTGGVLAVRVPVNDADLVAAADELISFAGDSSDLFRLTRTCMKASLHIQGS